MQLNETEAQSFETLMTERRPQFINQSRVVVAVSCACAFLCGAMFLASCYRLSVLERKIDALQSKRQVDAIAAPVHDVGNVPTALVRMLPRYRHFAVCLTDAAIIRGLIITVWFIK